MKQVFYVRKDFGGSVLNLAGGWSKNLGSYRVAYFDTEAEAQAAIPAGVEASVRPFTDKEKPPRESEGFEFFIMGKNNKFLDPQDAFTLPNHRGSVAFDTQDAALDKAEALGVHLDNVDIIRLRKPA